MEIFRFHNWCTRAVRGIKYKPDREAVWNELFNHLQDRQEDFMAQGLSENDARIKAMDAMGDPDEIAPLLAKIHRPFWGYAYSISKWILVLILCFALNPTISFSPIFPKIIRKKIGLFRAHLLPMATQSVNGNRKLLHLLTVISLPFSRLQFGTIQMRIMNIS